MDVDSELRLINQLPTRRDCSAQLCTALIGLPLRQIHHSTARYRSLRRATGRFARQHVAHPGAIDILS